MPFGAGKYSATGGEVTLLTFSDDTDLAPAIYEEGHLGGRFSVNPEGVTTEKCSAATMFSRSIPIEEYLQ